MPLIVRVKNKGIAELMGKEKFIKSILEKGDEICAYERPQIREGSDDNFLLEVKIMQSRRSYFMYSGPQTITYSRLFIFERRSTVKEVKLRIF